MGIYIVAKYGTEWSNAIHESKFTMNVRSRSVICD